MAAGDHLFVWTSQLGVPFQHHGIDVGDGTVVHFTNGSGGVAGPGGQSAEFQVQRTPIDVMTRDGELAIHVVDHRDPLEAKTIVRRALSQVGRKGYNLLFDNCEHFANWCATGKVLSRQVNTACTRISAASVKAITAGAIRTATRVGAKRLIRGTNIGLLVAEAAQWATEVGGHHVGLRDPESRRKAGRAVGGVTAVGFGALGGPLGIAVAGTIWATGEFAGEASCQVYEQLRERYSK